MPRTSRRPHDDPRRSRERSAVVAAAATAAAAGAALIVSGIASAGTAQASAVSPAAASTAATSAAASTSAAATASCVPTSRYRDVLSETFNGYTADVTLGGTLPLCTTLYAEGTAWTFDTATSLFPQSLAYAGPVIAIKNPGTYVISTARICGQRDIYGAVGSTPKFPAHLTGPAQPYEANLLSTYASGAPTSTYNTPASCVPTTPPATTPPVTTPPVTTPPVTTPPVTTPPVTTPPVVTTSASVLPTRITSSPPSTSPAPSHSTAPPVVTTSATVLPTRITSTSGGGTPGGGLPQTGGYSSGVGLAGLSLLGLGGLTLLAARRRHR